jgi:hypothetical protein
VESPLRRDPHGGFGERPGETDREQSRHRAPGRLSGKLRRCTDRSLAIVEFYLYLTAALITVRQLIQQARTRYRWPARPTTRRLK